MNMPDLDAYLLHARNYGENGLLLDLFTRQQGRLSAVARGARTANRRSILQPFHPLSLSLSGKKELKSLRHCESAALPHRLVGDQVLLGLYVNELLVRLLDREEPMEGLYGAYMNLLEQLAANKAQDEVALRVFEFGLLAYLGYAVSFDMDLCSNQPIVASARYSFIVDQGFVRVDDTLDEAIPGRDILDAGSGMLSTPGSRRVAKKVARLALARLLGSKPLNSRQLFVESKHGNRNK